MKGTVGSVRRPRGTFLKGRSSQGGDDIGPLEVLTLEKERFARILGQRISKAVAEVQARRMAAGKSSAAIAPKALK